MSCQQLDYTRSCMLTSYIEHELCNRQHTPTENEDIALATLPPPSQAKVATVTLQWQNRETVLTITK